MRDHYLNKWEPIWRTIMDYGILDHHWECEQRVNHKARDDQDQINVNVVVVRITAICTVLAIIMRSFRFTLVRNEMH